MAELDVNNLVNTIGSTVSSLFGNKSSYSTPSPNDSTKKKDNTGIIILLGLGFISIITTMIIFLKGGKKR